MRPALVVSTGLLALAARTAAAQEAVLLQLRPPVGQVSSYGTDVDTWLRTPLLAQPDTTLPTVRIRMHVHRTVIASDSASYTARDVTDSSSVDIPALAGANPWPASTGDILHGLVTETVVRAGGRGVTTRVVSAPAAPSALPALLRGVIGLAISSSRLTAFSFPARPVNPGETWTDTLRYDLDRDPSLEGSTARGTGISTTRFRLERVDQRDGHRIAIVVATSSAEAAAEERSASATMAFTGSARLEVDLDAARVVRTEMMIEGAMITRAGSVPVRMRLVQSVD